MSFSQTGRKAAEIDLTRSNTPPNLQHVDLDISAQHLHFVGGNSNKFYTIVDLRTLRADTYAIMYGRHSALGSIRLIAAAEVLKRHRQKLDKGYVPHTEDQFDGADTRRFANLVDYLRHERIGGLAGATAGASIQRLGNRLILSLDAPGQAGTPPIASPLIGEPRCDSVSLTDLLNTWAVPVARF